ncbi:MAG TPA: hypothetical protein VMV24_00720 [Candidatus Dormibacteraeota bacterium]|nr:hypothetical protein [Candidatus Dormibacteraeota bacterium]
MRSIKEKLKPKNGIPYVIHVGLNALLPFLLFILMHFDPWFAITLFLISKWRVLAVKPRYWLPNLRANGIDIIVGLSYLEFLNHTNSEIMQLVFAVLYVVWLTVIKPKSSSIFIAMQAFFGQFIGLMAIFSFQSSLAPPLVLLIISTWLVCYLTARHFFTIFDEPFASMYSHAWGYFSAALVWVLGHWLLYYYGTYAQPTVLLSSMGLGLGSLYYLKENGELNSQSKKQIVMVMIALVFVIVFLSDWSSKTF